MTAGTEPDLGAACRYRSTHAGQDPGPLATSPCMSINTTIMNTVTGQAIQKMKFERMPKPWASFNLETGELVTAERIDVGKPAPGKFIAPVDVWVTLKPKD